ncbi:hypothetical protein PtA15_1A676 [Puccinia triticina]|uniref:Uncharacterized protein n=1 Tax=Puccinia triticina TaxID=208348 RepID=A0ABY7C837_9BASI|nr:uncharacterized protein PtA15_1A676 [Puccinia triticina]WAQ81336.1 hypothetical protein PtA15_1A676 [Puccinia triticina]
MAIQGCLYILTISQQIYAYSPDTGVKGPRFVLHLCPKVNQDTRNQLKPSNLINFSGIIAGLKVQSLHIILIGDLKVIQQYPQILALDPEAENSSVFVCEFQPVQSHPLALDLNNVYHVHAYITKTSNGIIQLKVTHMFDYKLSLHISAKGLETRP